jgi:hypothetical protein
MWKSCSYGSVRDEAANCLVYSTGMGGKKRSREKGRGNNEFLSFKRFILAFVKRII